jgi:hypothetical protein
MVMFQKYLIPCISSLVMLLIVNATFAQTPVRILVWDEQQPEQKQAYGDKFLGETIAASLQTRPGLSVKSASLRDPQQGLSPEILDQTDVLVVWSHIRVREQDDVIMESIVQRVMKGQLSLIALHSAHWHKVFVRLMQERTKADAMQQALHAESAQHVAARHQEGAHVLGAGRDVVKRLRGGVGGARARARARGVDRSRARRCAHMRRGAERAAPSSETRATGGARHTPRALGPPGTRRGSGRTAKAVPTHRATRGGGARLGPPAA